MSATGLSETCVLSAVNLQVKAGSFVMIAGAVGSGKSTLLASLACARPALHGSCHTNGRRAYVPQKPFLLNGTIREDITFGLPYDEERYNSCVEMAALPDDLKTLTRGDYTLVGESGVQLSGGQKARVALARAIYTDADVVCLDDVLSAVDAHTARFIWQKCFVEFFLKSKKTLILVSHQIQYLSRPEVDSIIMLRDGQIWLEGPWSVLAHSGDTFLSLVQAWKEEEDAKDAKENTQEHASHAEARGKENEQSRVFPSVLASISQQVWLHECQSALASVLGALDGRRIDRMLIERVHQALSGEHDTDLVREGSISWPDFKVYLQAFGSTLIISLMLLLMIFSAISQIMSTLWLAAWTGGTEERSERESVLIYFGLGVSTSLANCVQAVLLTAGALAASHTIHHDMLHKILAAPMSFFDSSPTGRVLNRFLQDLQNIDSFVPNSISDQIMKTLNIITQLSLIYIEAPWVLCTLPVLAVPYSMIYRRMRIPNRDSRRLESAARSPVYAHFNDTLHGRETVRAFGAEAETRIGENVC
ncbi:ATP-binding cassette sub-family C member 4 (MRP/cMOAT-related ABC transporter) (Multi-specific organic anion transporter B) (MOAT-B) (Multidrug resistance-associated protein 4) [Durusdinium trenchii]|uniref:ATP-binding cassette sub-family C member 4 (MRP/cMOAT-related ABC transporter) (Multi-specific organic anion transporter B) (MOAT-B) (Multidrug resistance-associated protein 4) n=1 Tax=Durusdinium trenchii TaxID=1381693 RepID=A0ABP0IK12_9DINO